jgi:phosphoribosylpyrophosphate synthetase
MISHGKDIKIFSGNSNTKLAEEICKLMGTKLGEAEVGTFSDGEIFVSLYETVRGSDVFRGPVHLQAREQQPHGAADHDRRAAAAPPRAASPP